MTRRKAQPTPANDGAKLHLAVAPESAPFPEEPFPEAPPAELAHALVGPDRVDNYDRLAAAVPQPPAPPPAPSAPVQAARRAAPRRVSAEVVKAETALINLERRRQDSLAHAETVWAAKRSALIEALPDDVYRALVAMKVLRFDEQEPGDE